MDDQETKPAHERLGAEAKTLAGHQRRLEALAGALRKVAKVAETGRNPTLAAAEELAVAKKAIDGLEEVAGPMVAKAGEALKEIVDVGRNSAQKEAMRLLADLNEKLVAGGGSTLAGHYPEVHSGALTLVFDLSAKGMSVSLYYGPHLDKLTVVAGADANGLFKTLSEEQKKLDDGLEPPETFLPQLVAAWRTAGTIGTTRAPSDALPILDVLSMLAYQRQSKRFHHNPTKAAFSTFGRTMFSFQLYKLTDRRVGDLELVLGIATREDVKAKASLWVPRNARGDGNHYSTLGFRKVR